MKHNSSKEATLDFCRAHRITEEQFHGREKISGDLDLSSVTTLPDGFNPTVGGYLYLSSVTTLPDGFNPTVGGSLYLSSVTTLPDGFNPTVGGYVIWKNGRKHIGSKVDRPVRPRPVPQALTWSEGKYIKVDGIFSEVISSRGNVFRTRHIAKKEIEYLVTDGNGAWAHGASLEEAREDLLYKVGNRSIDEFKKLDPNQALDFAQAVALYRTVTGACAAGVRGFVERNTLSKDRTYTVLEMVTITKGAFGAEYLQRFASQLPATTTA